MSTLPKDDSTPQLHEPNSAGADATCEGALAGPVAAQAEPGTREGAEPPAPQPLLFQNWEHSAVAPAERIPHLGHCVLLALFALIALLLSSLAVSAALRVHLYGIGKRADAMLDIHYTLGSELILYLVTLAIAYFVFPLFWQKSFLDGIQWNGRTAARLHLQLIFCAFLCFLLAMLSGLLISSPKNAPIDKIFQSPGAPWLMFAFGVTIAPFFEEMFFRGFFLPAMCTACDWVNERINKTVPPLLGERGHPRWSRSAMISGASFTSLAFAAIHLAQTGYSWGSFALLICVSLVLSVVRLTTRSLAASVLVHAAYNFLLFSVMLIGSEGFRHMDKL